MANITTCTACGGCYEAGTEEAANEPGRLCPTCWHEGMPPRRMVIGPYTKAARVIDVSLALGREELVRVHAAIIEALETGHGCVTRERRLGDVDAEEYVLVEFVRCLDEAEVKALTARKAGGGSQ